MAVRLGGRIQGQRSIYRYNKIFQQIKVRTSIVKKIRLILTRKFIPYIIFMIQGHLKC